MFRSRDRRSGSGSGQLTRYQVSAREVHRVYGSGEASVCALRAVSLEVLPASFTAIMGPSGSGKSTLLQCLGGIDRVSSGAVRWGETDITGLSEKRLAQLRRERAGFVFQSFNLMSTMTVARNMELPQRLAGHRVSSKKIDEALDAVGMGGYGRRRPDELSGGQQQRVAIARALLSQPAVVFADEPTGSLDRATGADILSMLRRNVDDYGQTCLMVTHDPAAAAYADRVVFLADGTIYDDLTCPDVTSVTDRLTRPVCTR